MSFELKALKDICTIQIGKTPSRHENDFWRDGTHAWLSIADMNQGRYLTTTKECITDLGVRASNIKLIPKNTLVLSYKLSIGKVGITQKPMYTNEAIASLTELDPQIDINYLYWALQHIDLLENADRAAMGKTLNKAKLSEVKIPLPPLPEQRRIASILDQADELRQKRQQAIEKLDQLLQATFIDMFGDPVSNPKGWDLYKLSDLGSISTGNTPSRDDADNFGNYLEWIKSDNLNNDEDYATTATEYLSEKGAKKGRVVPEGSILVTCIAGSFDCIGNLAMVDRKVSFNQQINSITPNDTVVLEFLYYLMKISKPIIQNASTNSMKGMISKSKFSEILLPIPSKEKQIQFVELFKKLYGLKVSHKLYSNNADSLFKSLQIQAFNGTL
ncbi:restriction endonuclease subunit S [Acinetobacter baumannii]|uniref:restriction endonuclease subunit S n=1 Tax=Acinetobacter baumannii TaxID=470 RepID=UPI00280D6DCC|nr:restriction endonuclease subunit S [Acinetobacter baumannii]MDQ8940484.1 restriction endonuclease subunit S [Acinetobacter baumannii]